jgi:hypothetical protein
MRRLRITAQVVITLRVEFGSEARERCARVGKRMAAGQLSTTVSLTDLGTVKVDVRSAPMSRRRWLGQPFQKVPVNWVVAQLPTLSYK